MKNKGKVGGIVDKRFGESNSTLTPEEKMLERFTKEQQVNNNSKKLKKSESAIINNEYHVNIL
jgi:nucleolar protein 14